MSQIVGTPEEHAALRTKIINGAFEYIDMRGLTCDDQTREKLAQSSTLYVEPIMDFYTGYKEKTDKVGRLDVLRDVPRTIGHILAERLANSYTVVPEDFSPMDTVMEAVQAHLSDADFNSLFETARNDPVISAYIAMGLYDAWGELSQSSMYDIIESCGGLTDLVTGAIKNTYLIADAWNSHKSLLSAHLNLHEDLSMEFGREYVNSALCSPHPDGKDVLKNTLHEWLDKDVFTELYPEDSNTLNPRAHTGKCS